ncbi:MAG: DUF3794 domain-containing protein [Oscillospiraceae bacterium]|nr:DUF3794 domain-containing protein [Oscillospiraceae bacterium]
MEAKLNTEPIEYLKAVLDVGFTQEETAEAIVPDAYPDLETIVDVEGNITLRSKEAGAGRVSVSGTVAVSVVYQPEGEGGLRGLDLAIPFTAGYDAAEITDNAEVVVTAKLGSIDARMIHSRKLLVRADILVEARGFERVELTLTSALEDETGHGLHVRQETLELGFATQVREKTFVLSDEFALPAGRPPIGQILKSRVRLVADDVKNVGSKLIFKGRADIHVLYSAEHTGEPHVFDFSAAFSQIMELDGAGEQSDYEVALMLTNIYIEGGAGESGTLGAELHMVAQVVERRTKHLRYISDTYSTRFELETERLEMGVESLDPNALVTAELREGIELPTPMMRVVDSASHVGRVQMSQEDGSLVAQAAVFVSVVYMTEEGRITGLTRRFEVRAEHPMVAGRTYTVSAETGGEVQVLQTTDGMEVRVPVVFILRPNHRSRFGAIHRITWDEETPRDMGSLPSVVVFHAEGGESLWHLAKRYSSTEGQIIAANGLGEDAVPYPGQLFIIPKAR